MEEIIKARGHKNVLATHKRTIEFTTEDFLTPKGDCIVAIRADRGLADLDERFKEKVRSGAKVTITIESGGFKDEVIGYGHPDLTLTDKKSAVIRMSGYICDRTLCIGANKAAFDLDRKMVQHIKTGADVSIKINVAP